MFLLQLATIASREVMVVIAFLERLKIHLDTAAPGNRLGYSVRILCALGRDHRC